MKESRRKFIGTNPKKGGMQGLLKLLEMHERNKKMLTIQVRYYIISLASRLE